MSSPARCDCCDLPVESCGKAAEQRQRREQDALCDALRARGWFPAQWAGTCEGCGERFSEGALIHMSPSSGWRSECCA